jgi:hypothetical protein
MLYTETVLLGYVKSELGIVLLYYGKLRVRRYIKKIIRTEIILFVGAVRSQKIMKHNNSEKVQKVQISRDATKENNGGL